MELALGQKYQVKVVKITPRYIVVSMPDDTTEIIHISQIANCFVKYTSDFVSVDQTYEAEAVEGNNRPVELSLKHLDLKSTYRPRQAPAERRSESKYAHKSLDSESFEYMLAKSTSDMNDKCASRQEKHRRNTSRSR